ncbi:hypothetical protein NND54_00810 [Streptococcus mutans]|uniref:hypothetical protein n=1 Tax=Streptococcus mutans TaxID=1309 RepID=UPI0028EC2344|nr:hypothetical protein [Streptococcus mutans]MDT9489373.1 hypothetical protein [Streptococcus mutans]
MITFLIRNSYIDETYPDYITYFYPNSLNREDKEFIMAVQGEEKLPWDYHLTNITEVYNNRLDTSDFEREEVLNYDLFGYVISEDNKERLIPYFIENRLKFLVSFFGKSSLERQKVVINYLVNYNPNLVESLLSSKDFLYAGGFAMIQRMLFDDFLLLNQKLSPEQKEQLSQFVSNSWNFIWYEFTLTGEVDDYVDLILNLKSLDVRIKEFNFSSEYGELNNKVYDNNLYLLNINNITKLLLYLDSTLNEDDIKHRNFSIINSDDKFSHLLDYVKENVEDYAKVIVEQSDGEIKDEVEHIYYILNNEDISDETKTKYLAYVDDNILSLSEINSITITDKAVKLNKAVFDTKNILDYFDKYDTWNKLLIDFVNFKGNFNFDNEIFEGQLKENQEKFFLETAKCNELKNNHYKIIMSSISWKYTVFPTEEISDEKMNILIETESIEFSVDILTNMRSKYPASVIEYILKYLDGYIENIDDVYDENEILEVLDREISFEKAQMLVDKFNGTISIKDKKYNSSLLVYIIKNKFDDTDLPMLLENYQAFDNMVQEVILQKAKADIKDILANAYSVDGDLLLLLIKDNSIDLDDRRLLYSRNIPHNKVEKVLEDLQFLSLFEKYQQIIQEVKEHKNPKISVTEYNENLLSFLQDKECFKSFEEDLRNNNDYRIYSFRKRLKN